MKKAFLLYAFLMLAMSLQAKNYFSQYGFIENKGQIINQNNQNNLEVKYICIGNGIKLQIKEHSFSYEVVRYSCYKKNNLAITAMLEKNITNNSEKDNWLKRINDSIVIYSHRIDVELVGANPQPELKADGQIEDYLNYYTTGTPEAGVTYVHQYHKVTYKDIYPNIDLEFVANGSNQQPFKYNFIVKPGGRVADILIRYNGAKAVELNPQGSINITTAYASFEESIPRSYIAEIGKDLSVSYQQNREGVFGFSVGNYNAEQTLVIDPWCTYFGWDGNLGTSSTSSVFADNSNNIYVIGTTSIGSNIASSGAYQTIYGGGASDAFIRKFNASGNPIWCTYYGGNSNDEAIGIDCDEFSNLYITGPTWSTNNIATSGSLFQTLPATSFTSFLSKFNANGIRQWGTYYPAASIRVKADYSNNVIIGGASDDTNAVTQGSHQTIPGGNGDDFIAKFTSIGTRLWGTFYGGSELEKFTADIAVDGQGNIFLSGTTFSSNNISTTGSFQSNYAGAGDNFLVKFNSLGVRQWGTYYGGIDIEEHTTYISTNANGDIFFTGEAESVGVFATSGSFQSVNGGGIDYCLAKFNTNGLRLWGTYFGGNDDDQVLSLKIDKGGNPIFSGYTFSTNAISTPNSYQISNNGKGDDFIEKFSPSGTRLWGNLSSV